MARGRQKTGVGLDIGSYAVKIVEISGANGKMSLAAGGLKKARDATREGVIDCIKALAAEAGVTSREANISVSGPSVIVRFIVMPKMTDEDLRSAIKFEAEKHIPFNINECVIGHHAVKGLRKDNKQDVMLVAAKKDLVADRVRMAESAGFSVGVVDVDGFAVTNSFMANFPGPGREKTIALLDVGARITNLSIICGTSILLARDIGMGVRDFDASISKRFRTDAAAAEELRMAPGDKEADVASCLKAVCNNLCDDVKLSFGYYENQCGKGIDEAYISGGGAAVKGLNGLLQEMLGLKSVPWDPLRFLDTGSAKTDLKGIEGVKGHFAVAAGLALR